MESWKVENNVNHKTQEASTEILRNYLTMLNLKVRTTTTKLVNKMAFKTKKSHIVRR